MDPGDWTETDWVRNAGRASGRPVQGPCVVNGEPKVGKLTILDLQAMKERGQKIVMLTAYDYHTARLLDEAGVDVLLVGDSAGMVMAGRPNTLSVTVEEILYHLEGVRRAAKRALVVADMPFLSYQLSPQEAKRNAGRMVKEGGAEAVKVEGGTQVADLIRAICDMDVPVMGHIGLTPQSIHRLGGWRVQGRRERERRKLLEDALAVQEAGAFAVVLELVAADVAEEITRALRVPTIGIGSGPHCDGQVLVLHDLLGLNPRPPRFVKVYANLEKVITGAIRRYAADVREGRFPTRRYSFTISGKKKPQQ